MGRLVASLSACLLLAAAFIAQAGAQGEEAKASEAAPEALEALAESEAVSEDTPVPEDTSVVEADHPLLAPATPIEDLLRALGEPPPEHWIPTDAGLAVQGEAIVLTGKGVDPFGKKGSRVSAAFDCTDCHNVVREDPSLLVSDAEARLGYAQDNGLKLLPGTTLWGIVNRESWFNDDYLKKYGSLVKPANDSLRWALQLCSAECSQGRSLAGWEMDAVLTYLWTLQMTVGDLGLSAEAVIIIEAALTDPNHRTAAVAAVRASYLTASPAHTGGVPGDREAGYGNSGDPATGAFIYNESCLVCHANGGPGTYRLGANKRSYNELLRNRTKEDNRSFYQAVRHGTRPYGVPMAYMPFFTKERLTDQQLDDLLAFLEAEVAK
jgi:mono/diheme cytochrome c family protein